MNIPCRIKALKYVKYGDFEMNSGTYANVTIEREKNSNRHRMVKVTSYNQYIFFTDTALEGAIKRGDFSIS